MTQGIWVIDPETNRIRRPKSKKEMKEILALSDGPDRVIAESTSWFEDEYDGPVRYLDAVTTVSFVGPDPNRDRRFYGTIRYKNGKAIIS